MKIIGNALFFAILTGALIFIAEAGVWIYWLMFAAAVALPIVAKVWGRK